MPHRGRRPAGADRSGDPPVTAVHGAVPDTPAQQNRAKDKALQKKQGGGRAARGIGFGEPKNYVKCSAGNANPPAAEDLQYCDCNRCGGGPMAKFCYFHGLKLLFI